MTKKDYELIAQSLNFTTNNRQEESIRYKIAYGLVMRLQVENPLFDQRKFLKACGLED